MLRPYVPASMPAVIRAYRLALTSTTSSPRRIQTPRSPGLRFSFSLTALGTVIWLPCVHWVFSRPEADYYRRDGVPRARYRRRGSTAACARSANGAGTTPSSTTPASAIASARPPANEGAHAAAAPSGSRMYM